MNPLRWVPGYGKPWISSLHHGLVTWGAGEAAQALFGLPAGVGVATAIAVAYVLREVAQVRKRDVAPPFLVAAEHVADAVLPIVAVFIVWGWL